MFKLTSRIRATILTVVVVIASVITPLLSPMIASAVTALPTCTATYLDEEWNWVDELKRTDGPVPGAYYGGNQPTFNYDTDSYVIYKTASTASAGRNVFNILLGTETNKFTFDEVAGVKKLYYSGTIKTGLTLTSEPNTVKAPSQNWNGSSGGSWSGTIGVNGGGGAFASYSGSTSSTGSATLDSPGINCIYAAHNVSYAPGWVYDTYDADAGVGLNPSQSCDTLDIGCYLKTAFTKVKDTFRSVGMFIVSSIASLFSPDGDQVQDDVDDLSAFMTAKFGFLAYPFTFFNDFFDAFNDTSNNWCTTSSCTKNFGSFYGHDFVVNLTQAKTTMPTYYNWFVAMMRGLVVLALILSLRQTFIKVLHK